MLRAILGGAAAAGQILGIFLVHVLFALVTVVAGGHQPLADRRVHLQVDDAVRCGQAQQMELVIEQPVQKLLPLLRRELGALVHRVGGGVAVSNDHAALLVKAAPIGLVAGIAVHRKKAGGRIGVHIVRF